MDQEGFLAIPILGVVLAAVSPFAHKAILMPVGLVTAAVGGVAFYRARSAAPPTPEQRLAAEADGVVRGIGGPYEFNPSLKFNRLHRAFHPTVVAILEECAGYYARVAAALDEGDWGHRSDLRTSALTAAKVAMDEALVLAGKTLPYTPEARPLDLVSDALEDVGFGSLIRRAAEPMPPAFRPARELAERLRELAVRCETAAQQRREESPEPVSAAFRHLDATIGEMRRIEEAETELRQGA